MSDIFRFKDFPVYIDARRLRRELRTMSKKSFPDNEQYCLTSQLWRALDSIMLNIAEGSDRYSDVDFSRFLNNSLTSVNEVAACLDCAIDEGYIKEKEHVEYLKQLENLGRQLKAFSSKVRNDSKHIK